MAAGGSRESFVKREQSDDYPTDNNLGLMELFIDTAARTVVDRNAIAATDGQVCYAEGVVEGQQELVFESIIGAQPDTDDNFECSIAGTDDMLLEDCLDLKAVKDERADIFLQKEISTKFWPQKCHRKMIRKDVPRAIAYRARGVRCKICWMAFKGDECVKVLLQHTMQKHSEVATSKLLLKVRKDNSYKKILGRGIRYCTCETCLFTGLARWDKRYDQARNTNFIGRK